MAPLATLPPIVDVPAAHLTGRTLPGGWIVRDLIEPAPSATGGYFSICYRVEHPGEGPAFLKALNVAAVLASHGPSLMDALQVFSNTFVFERDLLAHCSDRGLSRIIHLLDSGEVEIKEAAIIGRVPYLIFELADGDVRAHQAALVTFDLAWVLRALQHVALGIEQLHASGAAHQDLKPSNVLTQDGGSEMKIGDLGRADRRGITGPTSKFAIPGALPYAPPEQLCGAFSHTWEERRAADLYHLGSLSFFFFLQHSATALLKAELPDTMGFEDFVGDFDALLPHLHQAHSLALQHLEVAVRRHTTDSEIVEKLVSATGQLTNPDPKKRGHPKDHAARASSSYSVRRYVSLFNLLSSRARRLG